ncbi:MAG: Holliday junction branch migration DNA helicase RuvB [Holosporales bacterium]|nr:Holliday junction branch migration DNA helicase RuvB [Holosporales bacterium]
MRIVSGEALSVEELHIDRSLRPKRLESFTGQRSICENLDIFIRASILRNESLDHVLMSGPPGLGKTTLSQIIALEMGTNIKITSGPILSKPGDLASLLTNLQEKDILFIDEIHRMNPSIEEILYPAMEDFKIDIMIGEGQSARALRLDLPQFTLIGATTRLGLLSPPLRERFGIPFRFNFYNLDELCEIILRNSRILGINMDEKATLEIANRSRGTPRIASRLLRRVRDFANVSEISSIDSSFVVESLNRLNVDPIGLDSEDKKYLNILRNLFGGGPVGVETLAASLSETSNTLEDVIEPYLLQQGLIQKTPRGRTLTERGFSFSN